MNKLAELQVLLWQITNGTRVSFGVLNDLFRFSEENGFRKFIGLYADDEVNVLLAVDCKSTTEYLFLAKELNLPIDKAESAADLLSDPYVCETRRICKKYQVCEIIKKLQSFKFTELYDFCFYVVCGDDRNARMCAWRLLEALKTEKREHAVCAAFKALTLYTKCVADCDYPKLIEVLAMNKKLLEINCQNSKMHQKNLFKKALLL